MIYRHKQEDIDKYYDSTFINQSSIKEIIKRGLESFLFNQEKLLKQEDFIYYEEKEHYLVGTASDQFLTMGEDYYLNKYHFSRLEKKPKDTALSIIKQVFDRVKSRTNGTIDGIWEFDYYLEDIYIACNDHSYYMNRRKANHNDDVRYKELNKQNAIAYWRELKEAGNKIVLSDRQSSLINSITNSFLYHPFTSKLFKSSENIDIVYQFPCYFKMGNIDCKALIDMIRIDHREKRIYPIDIKTMGDFVTRFRYAIESYRYDIQAAFYTEAIERCFTQLATLINKHLIGYSIAPFAFIVSSTINPGIPLIFPLSVPLLQIAKYGESIRNIRGFMQGLDILSEFKGSKFNLETLLSKNNGVVFVNELYDYNNHFSI